MLAPVPLMYSTSRPIHLQWKPKFHGKERRESPKRKPPNEQVAVA